MSDKRKIQHEGIIALINYSTLCAKKCDVLKTHDDKLTAADNQCLRVCVDQVAQTFSVSNDFYSKLAVKPNSQ